MTFAKSAQRFGFSPKYYFGVLGTVARYVGKIGQYSGSIDMIGLDEMKDFSEEIDKMKEKLK